MLHTQRILVIGCVVILVLFVVQDIWLDTNIRPFTTLYKVLQNKGLVGLLDGIVKGSRDEQLRQQISAASRESPSDPTISAIISQYPPQQPYNKYDLKNCTPTVDPSNKQTAFKFYVYNLPLKFNYDVQRQLTDEKTTKYWYNLDYCGTGEEIVETKQYEQSENVTNQGLLSIRNTHQFALEVIIHHKLLHSPYRTTDPQQADMFYIPAYTGLNCAQHKGDSGKFVKDLFEHLETHESKNYKSGKPHFSTLSKIQKEQCLVKCPTLKHPATQNVTYFIIEKEINPDWARKYHAYGTSVIVAPYPSYIHFNYNGLQDKSLYETKYGLTNLTQSQFQLPAPLLSKRTVTLFLASSFRRNNPIRRKLVDHFRKNKTSLHPDEFHIKYNCTTIDQIMLITSRDTNDHRTTTIQWMQQSVFCLQPPGDSPTRKSFYDSILSGCIPVLFTHPSSRRVEYPFMKYLNYDTFTYTVDEKLISRYDKNIYSIIKDIPHTKVIELHENLLKSG